MPFFCAVRPEAERRDGNSVICWAANVVFRDAEGRVQRRERLVALSEQAVLDLAKAWVEAASNTATENRYRWDPDTSSWAALP